MDVRPIAGVFLAVTVGAPLVFLLGGHTPTRTARLVERFPELARACPIVPAESTSYMTTTRHKGKLAFVGGEQPFIPDPYLRRDGALGGDSYDRGLQALLAAEIELMRRRENLVADESAALHGKPVDIRGAQRYVAEWAVRVQDLEEAVADAKRERPRMTEPLVQRNRLMVLFRDDADAEQIAELLAHHRLIVQSGLPEISLFFVVSADPPSITSDGEAARLHALVQRLKTSDLVEAAAQNLLLGGDFIPGPNKPKARNWFDPNDPLTNSSFPQAWNFIGAMRNVTTVGVLDKGFLDSTKDRRDIEVHRSTTPPCGTKPDFHGTFMAGVIGAKFDNKIDTDGGSPSVYVIGCGVEPPGNCNDPNLAASQRDICINSRALDKFICGLDHLLGLGIQLINASISYKWSGIGVDTDKPAIRNIVSNHGEIVRKLMAKRGQAILVASSGNDNGASATWASPFNWAALGATSPAENIIVADAVDVGGVPLPTSNVGGTIRVIAHAIPASIEPNTRTVDFASGTSGAAALVTATVAMMRSIDPNVSPADIKIRLGIVRDSAVPLLQAYPAIRQCLAKPDEILADLDGRDGITDVDFEAFKRIYTAVRKHTLPDFNGDRVHDERDAKFLREDLNADGTVDKKDLEVMIAAWGLSGPDADALRKRLEE